MDNLSTKSKSSDWYVSWIDDYKGTSCYMEIAAIA